MQKKWREKRRRGGKNERELQKTSHFFLCYLKSQVQHCTISIIEGLLLFLLHPYLPPKLANPRVPVLLQCLHQDECCRVLEYLQMLLNIHSLPYALYSTKTELTPMVALQCNAGIQAMLSSFLQNQQIICDREEGLWKYVGCHQTALLCAKKGASFRDSRM